jgi:hypothetical protein
VAYRSRSRDASQERIAIAIALEGHDALAVAGVRPPPPISPRLTLEIAGRQRSDDRLTIGARDHQHVAGLRVLRHDRHKAGVLGKIELRKVEHDRSERCAPGLCFA